jgi:hypothetical protein
MIRPITFIAFLLACGSGLYLYQTKHRVKLLDDQIAQVVNQTNALREQTRMLSAEWTLLNDPERLQQLATQYLPNLKTVSPDQFTSMADLDSRLPPAIPAASPANPSPADGVPVASNTATPGVAGSIIDTANAADTTALADARLADAKSGESAAARLADATSADPKDMGAARADAKAAASARPADHAQVAAVGLPHLADGAAAPRSAPVHVAVAHAAPVPVAAANAARLAARHAAGQRAEDLRLAAQRAADRRLTDQRLAERRAAEQRARPYERVAYRPPPRPLVAARAPMPANGGSFLGMAHGMNAPVPLPRPVPMSYGGSGG